MQRRYWIVIVVLLAMAFSATAGWATTIYWRNNTYVLPAYYSPTVMKMILTDHKRDINTLTTTVTSLQTQLATAQANIATNTANITTNTTNITTNTTNIATNASNISTNAGNISSNASSISSHVGNTGNAHSHDSRYVRDSGENLRVIRGIVDDDGTILRGSGFTVTKGTTGVYTITYDTPFSGIATPLITSLQHGLVNGYTVSTHYCTFTIDDVDNDPDDDDFTFVIVGP